MMTRRDAIRLGGSALGAALVLRHLPAFDPALAQGAGSVPVADLMQPGPLGDRWVGPESAKCTIVEYASLTCTHCAHFHAETWPKLKERYVDKGLVRFTLREFPLDPLATAGFMLARADDGAKYYPITDLLFDQQRAWAFVDKPLDALQAMMRQAGFSKEKFEATLKDQKLYDAVNAVKDRAYKTFKVDSTPTFFINGARFPGALSIDELEKVIKPIVGA
jgi:protein-disulfide isomerase